MTKWWHEILKEREKEICRKGKGTQEKKWGDLGEGARRRGRGHQEKRGSELRKSWGANEEKRGRDP